MSICSHFHYFLTVLDFIPQEQIKNIPSHLVSDINLGCQDSDLEHSYKVYVSTFLGYGANSARERYENLLALKQKSRVPT